VASGWALATPGLLISSAYKIVFGRRIRKDITKILRVFNIALSYTFQ